MTQLRQPSNPDVVYLVGPQRRNEELRYSLRSLANVPHGRVWIAGGAPRWARPDGLISVPRAGTAHYHTALSLTAAARHPDVAESFVLMNDDFFITHPREHFPTWHGGPLRVQRARYAKGNQHTFVRAMGKLADLMGDLLSYELHVPMPMTKAGVLEILELAIDPPTVAVLKRTIYGNHHHVGGEEHRDVKVFGDREAWSKEGPFLSTTDSSFTHTAVGRYLRSLFPDPSPYEEAEA
jgi:hypothetical protein